MRVRQIRNGNFLKNFKLILKYSVCTLTMLEITQQLVYNLKIFFQFRDKFYFYHNDKSMITSGF